MRGKWAQPGVPHKGWTCIDITDLGEPSEICEMCETQEIRYVHYMTHPDWADTLGCGCVCAGNMEEDYQAAYRREQELRKKAGKKQRWLKRPWRISDKGNSYINIDGYYGYNIVVYRTATNVWGFRVLFKLNNRRIVSKLPYPSEDAAKLRAYDAMEYMKTGAFVNSDC